jgi:hypothetical protein
LKLSLAGVTPICHCEEPFDAACGVAQDKLPLRGSDAAIQPTSPEKTGLPRFARNDEKACLPCQTPPVNFTPVA